MEFVRLHFTAIDSTNTWAMRNIHQLDPTKITLITADTQTRGKGRFMRQWVSPPKQNLYASFCFFVPKGQKSLSNISQVMGVTAVKTLEKSGFHPQLKWPNDILLSKKKVGGILCETQEVSVHTCLIVGIGININMQKELLQTIDQPATSLLMEGGSPRDVQAIMEALQAQFSVDLDLFLTKGFSSFLAAYKKSLIHSPHQMIRFRDYNTIWKGTFHSINDDGSLNLQLETGEIKRFVAGELV